MTRVHLCTKEELERCQCVVEYKIMPDGRQRLKTIRQGYLWRSNEQLLRKTVALPLLSR